MTQAIDPLLPLKLYKTEEVNIDVEAKVIRNVIMAKVGEARGHGEWIEQSFIDALVKYTNKTLKKDGVRCYFGHNWDGLGKRVGKFYNVRVEGDCAIGDLHLYESANDSPLLPGAADYILSMANEDKKSIMLSIRYRPGMYYQYNAEGKQVRVWYYHETEGWISPNRAEKIYVEFAELASCDIVDDGALTESLYAAGNVLVQFNEIINHPDFRKVLETNHESFTVLNEFYSKKSDGGILSYIKNIFKKDTMEKDPVEKQSTTVTPEAPVTTQAAAADYAALEERLKSFFAEKTEELKKEYQAQVDAQQAEITRLKGLAAAAHTAGDSEDEDPAPDTAGKSYNNNPVNVRARQMAEQAKKNKK